MADEDEQQQPQSIADRIAALKLNQVGKTPAQAPPKPTTNGVNSTGKPKPPPPPRPVRHERTQSSNKPPTQDHARAAEPDVNNLPEGGRPNGNANGMDGISRPSLPPRTPSQTPALPPRRPSQAPSTGSGALSRKQSTDSISSTTTARSGSTSATSQSDRYHVKAPNFEASGLPALPPKRSQEDKAADFQKYNSGGASRTPLRSFPSSPNIHQQNGTTPPPPARPSGGAAPALPARTAEAPTRVEPPPRQRPVPALPGRAEPVQNEMPAPPPRQRAEPPPPKKSALQFGFNNTTKPTDTTPAAPNRPQSTPQVDGGETPPPIPASSKPDLAALQASKPKPNVAAAPSSAVAPAGFCLQCRDFSAPDNHAARFSRESIPSHDVGWLAQQLTSPFPSATDKARAIFTWLHHNVAYDTVAFFNNNIKRRTPQETLSSGLAVCEGYASLFAALAMKVGLEAVVISGNGKGFGHKEVQPGQPIPPYSAGHAWNAVKIDNSEWKLLDSCWGAGNVNGKDKPYQKHFKPTQFTKSNDEFGLTHYPGDSSKQFRNDGRIMTWEEYILGNKDGCGAHFYGGFVGPEGFSAPSFQPHEGKIVPANCPGPTLRFSFQKRCPHWDPVRNGNGPHYLYALALENLKETKRNHVPFETNGDVWWCDVPVADLGRPGMKVQIVAMTKFDGADGRGLGIAKFREKMGRCGWASGFVCTWEVA